MKTQNVKSKTYSDTKFIRAKVNGKYLWIYLLTSEQSNLSGIFESSLELLSRETGLSEKEIDDVFKIYEKENMAYFFNDYVILKNRIMNNTLTNTNIVTGIFNQVNELPDAVKRFIKELDNELTWAIEGVFNVNLEITRKELYYSKNNSRSHAEKDRRSHVENNSPSNTKKDNPSHLNLNLNSNLDSNLHRHDENENDDLSKILKIIKKEYNLFPADIKWLEKIGKTPEGVKVINDTFEKVYLSEKEIENPSAYFITSLKKNTAGGK